VKPKLSFEKVEDGDVNSLDFLMIQKSQQVYISGWVKTETKFIGTLKARSLIFF